MERGGYTRAAGAAVTELGGAVRRSTRPPGSLARHARDVTEPAVAANPTVVAPARIAVRRGRGAALVERASLIGFGAIFALVRSRRTDAIDLAVTMKVQRRSHPLMARLMEAVSWPGFPPQSRLIPPILIALLLALRLRLEAVAMVGAWGTALVASIVKALMRRPRPVAGVDVRVIAAPLGGSSFPSGHTITYVGIYGFLAYLVHTLIRPVAPRRAVVAALMTLVGLVGPSRIHQGHHWFTDVSASYLLGIGYLLGLTRLYRGRKARATSEQP
jgi:membrane-associated phospholipid phosphatase